MLVDVGKISWWSGWVCRFNRLSFSMLAELQSGNFYGFTLSIPVNRRLPVIVRDFCVIRETPCWKKLIFFPLSVFGPPEYPGYRSTSDCPTAQSAPLYACFWSLLFFFLFFVIGGRYFPLSLRAAIFLVTSLGLGLSDPNPNPKPNRNPRLHLKKLPLLVIVSWRNEMVVYESTTWTCNMISLL